MMICLSMMQPWAWLIANGYVTVDDRPWPTHYRGLVGIHASKKFHPDYDAFIRHHTDWPLPPASELPFGGIVGVARLSDCLAPHTAQPSPLQQLHRSHFGYPGYHGFKFEEARPLPFLAIRGNRGLFEVELPQEYWRAA